MKIRCKAKYPAGVHVLGLGIFHTGDIVKRTDANAAIVDGLLLTDEWEKMGDVEVNHGEVKISAKRK